MTRRYPGRSPVRLLVAAGVAVVGATFVAMSLNRNTSDDRLPPAATDVGGSDGAGMAATTVPATTITAISVPASTMPATSSTTATGDGESLVERQGVYRWLWADPADIRFLWQDDAGVPYGQLQAARSAVEEGGERVVAITNGGIHRPGLIPSGLYIEDGVELRPLNRASGSGNFFLIPNGVFWVGDGQARIETTESYAAGSEARTVDGAVQSGPMLLIDSEINSRFSETSTSTHRRNAVGIDADGRVLLIMADRPVTLWELASRCREMGAVDALYLDGTLSRLEAVADGRPIFPNLPVASMIAVVR